METTLLDTNVGQIVATDYRTADVFKKYGIDFCCGGKKPLSKVCSEKNIDSEKILADLIALNNAGQLPSQNADKWELDFLIDYIVNTHHSYINQNIEPMSQYIEKVARVHGHAYTETVEVLQLWNEVVAEIKIHMMKEENVLFPYIKNLVKARNTKTTLPPPGFGTIQNPVQMMEHDHTLVGNLMKEIEKITNNYTPPAEACNTYRVSYAKLNEFAEDLYLHIHLENNILFPKAVNLETTLNEAVNTPA